MNGDLFFDGKKFISSKRAAQISGYVNDYIGQLCRDGKLECRMVGRTWYVGFESLIQHKNLNNSSVTKRGKRKGQPLLKKGEIRRAQVESEHNIAPAHDPILTVVQDGQSGILSPVQIKYIVDDSPLLPQLISKQTEIDVVVDDMSEESSEEYSIPINILNTEERHVHSRDGISVSTSLPKDIFNEHENYFYARNTAPETLVKDFYFSKIFTSALSFIFAILFVSTLVFSFTGARENVRKGISIIAQNTHKSLVQVNDSVSANIFSGAYSALRGTAVAFYDAVNSLMGIRSTTLVMRNPDEGNRSQTPVQSGTHESPVPVSKGMVVVPVDDQTVSQEEAIASIKNNFSDDVIVRPDGSGVSGVIEPVFKKVSGDEYLYVLVPVNE